MTDPAPRLQLLLHESEQLTTSIDRNINATHTMVGIILPAAMGVFALAFNKDATFRPCVLAAALASIFALGVVQINYLWVDTLGFVTYKYSVVMPELYRLTGCPPSTPNLSEFFSLKPRPGYTPLLLVTMALGLLIVFAACAACFYVEEHPAPGATPTTAWVLYWAQVYVWALLMISGASSAATFRAIRATQKTLREGYQARNAGEGAVTPPIEGMA